jgi:hypothetical protein
MIPAYLGGPGKALAVDRLLALATNDVPRTRAVLQLNLFDRLSLWQARRHSNLRLQ